MAASTGDVPRALVTLRGTSVSWVLRRSNRDLLTLRDASNAAGRCWRSSHGFVLTSGTSLLFRIRQMLVLMADDVSFGQSRFVLSRLARSLGALPPCVSQRPPRVSIAWLSNRGLGGLGGQISLVNGKKGLEGCGGTGEANAPGPPGPARSEVVALLRSNWTAARTRSGRQGASSRRLTHSRSARQSVHAVQ